MGLLEQQQLMEQQKAYAREMSYGLAAQNPPANTLKTIGLQLQEANNGWAFMPSVYPPNEIYIAPTLEEALQELTKWVLAQAQKTDSGKESV